MAQTLSGIDKLKGKVGVAWKPREYLIEGEMIRRFARAVGDTNPLWKDGNIAPPAFTLSIGFEQFVEDLMKLTPFNTVLMGSTEIESYQPIKRGDTITVVFKISNLRERKGQTGKMVFMTFESTYKNKEQELVARCRQMVIGY
jgi:acyl dehydratase